IVRITRICSEEAERKVEIQRLLNKFLSRGYPSNLLIKCQEKLMNRTRKELIKPKTDFILNHISLNSPNILSQFGISPASSSSSSSALAATNQLKVFVTMPFFKNILNYNYLIKASIHAAIDKCEDEVLKNVAKKLEFVTSFKKNKTISD